MRRINLLDKKVFDKIAAGEIVESPVSVVKELLENSLDAGASLIEIHIENSGMSLIRVMDNGFGIHNEDLELAFLSHATSKIYNEEDLDNIQTFGFRGEALASISAVSDIEIVSKTYEDTTGRFLLIAEGVVKDKGIKKIGTGTRIEVRNLFFNLPARKKFINNLNLESAKITELVTNYGIGHPNKDFILKRDNEVILDTRGSFGWEKRTEQIFSKRKSDFFIIEQKTDLFTLEGVLFNPLLSKNNKKSQIFFVNGRLIKSIFFNNILDEAYETLIQKGRFPLAVLNITIDPKYIDVNIHPAKTEIRFLEEKELGLQMLPIIKSILLKKIDYKNNLTSIPMIRNDYKPTPMPTPQKLDFYVEDNVQESLKEEVLIYKEMTWEEEISIDNHQEINFPSIGDLKIIGQFKNTFILAESENDLYIIDQHVVHERILFEKFTKEVNEKKVIKTPLLSPVTLFLTAREEGVLIKNIITLNDLGFDIESFGPQTYLVRTYPSNLEINNVEDFFADLLEDLDKIGSTSQGKIRESMIVTAACKGAIKANDKLSTEKLEYLLKELSKTNNYHTCPHGRPTFKKISVNELYRYFQRGGYHD